MTNRPDRSARWAILWLLFGGFAFGLGWFVGVTLLWDSRAWNVREKLLGTFVVPFGLAGSIFFAQILAGGTSETGACTTPMQRHGCVGTFTISHGPSVIGIIAAIIVLLAPIVVAFYLARRKYVPAQGQGTGIPAADLRSA
jgi:hypothetical protein